MGRWRRSSPVVVDHAGSEGAWRQAASLIRAGDIAVLNKADLPQGSDAAAARVEADEIGAEVLELSLIAEGVEPLRTHLVTRVIRDASGADFPAVTRQRHRVLLQAARGHLARAIASLCRPELAAEDTRLPPRARASHGRIGAEDVLDQNLCELLYR